MGKLVEKQLDNSMMNGLNYPKKKEKCFCGYQMHESAGLLVAAPTPSSHLKTTIKAQIIK